MSIEWNYDEGRTEADEVEGSKLAFIAESYLKKV